MRLAARGTCLVLCASVLLSGCLAGNTRPEGGAWPFPIPPSAPESETPSGEPSGEALPLPAPTLPPPRPAQPSLPIPPPVPPSASSQPPPGMEVFPRAIQASAPVLALVKQSREARNTKQYDRASASLERALRIEPRNPWLWQQMASLHLQAGQPEQAIAKSRKSVSLAKRNPWIELESYRVIAAAARETGDNALAQQAQQRYQDRQRWTTTPPLVAPQPQ